MTDPDNTRSFEDVPDEMTGDSESDPKIPRKPVRGKIDGYHFSLRVDGDAPDELVAEIEAALANVKADGETITLTERQQERIEAVQEASTEGGSAPPLTKSDVISSLLDTRDAVNSGYYTEDYTENSELRTLVSEWNKPENTRMKAFEAAAELEALIDDNTQDNE